MENYLARYLECHQVKVEHQHLARLLNTLPILEWKWENFSMDFINVLPRTKYQHYSVMVIFNTLKNPAHFIPIQYRFGTTQVANVFMKYIVKLHGIPKTLQGKDPLVDFFEEPQRKIPHTSVSRRG